MEYLDIYDENRNHIGTEKRDIVHQKGLWHFTVHCFLYDADGNVYFQIRKEEGKFYTTASGHVTAGETLKEAFGREVKEELGIDMIYDQAKLVSDSIFTLDKQKKDGSMFHDRVYCCVYIAKYEGDHLSFHLDATEVTGLVKVSAQDTIKLFENRLQSMNAVKIEIQNDGLDVNNATVTLDDFLVNPTETAMGKYGDVLKKVIELTS